MAQVIFLYMPCLKKFMQKFSKNILKCFSIFVQKIRKFVQNIGIFVRKERNICTKNKKNIEINLCKDLNASI